MFDLNQARDSGAVHRLGDQKCQSRNAETVLDPKDIRNPRLPFNCPHCGLRLAYMGTHHPPPDPLPTHIYRCEKHGLFKFQNDWWDLKKA